jgi:2-amino-4-hydroxy-6-hydroxymethyldihydropteridine diphosphokinase
VTVDALLSLGGNMGDRKALMDDAVIRLGPIPETIVSARSSYYRTEPDGPVKQEWFLNIGVSLRTRQSRRELVAACRAIEAVLGRDRAKEISWGPRPIDIDVVSYDGSAITDHRAFVIIPLAEIAPEVNDSAGEAGVEKLDWPMPPVSPGDEGMTPR